jgi:ring-1,2-phenylacetyl-CoA epoxidase subunit PaaC
MPPPAGDPHVLYVLRHGDDNLVLAQRLGEWISRGPELEEDIALGNVGLDHLGQARSLLTHAGSLQGEGRTEDHLAMFRTEREFSNLLLVEQPNDDFAHTMARSLFFDAYQVGFWAELANSADPTLAGIAAKAAKEAEYHRRHSSTWVVRLGDGTDESHHRMQRAVDALWPFTAEMFSADEVDAAMARDGIGVDPAALRPQWEHTVSGILERATITAPGPDTPQNSGGRHGFHTEHLGRLLSEMQWMQRSYPGLQW